MEGAGHRAILMVGFLLSMTFVIGHAEGQAIDVLERHSLFEIQGLEGAEYIFSMELDKDTTTIVDIVCDSCSVQVEINGTTTQGTSQIHELSEDSSGLLIIQSNEKQPIIVQVLVNIQHHGHSVRPAPTDEVQNEIRNVCNIQDICFQPTEQSLRNRQYFNQEVVNLYAGKTVEDLNDYLIFEVQEGMTIEWNWHFLTGDITTSVFFQDETETQILPPLTIKPSHDFSSFGLVHETMYLQTQESGRLILKFQGTNPVDYFSFTFIMYTQMETSTMSSELIHQNSIVGHGQQQIAFDWPSAHALRIQNGAHAFDLDMTYFAGIDLQENQTTILPFEAVTVFPYPNTTAGKLNLQSLQTFSFHVSLIDFTDATGIRDAQGYLPSTNLSSISSEWVLIQINESYSSQLTLSVFDTSDTYLFYIEGWEESIHFIEFKIEGNISPLVAQIWDIDQSTYETISTHNGVKTSSEIKVGQQVGRGYHILQVRLQNPENATPTEYGANVPSIHYTITSTYNLIDEGEEPWFPPDDKAKMWGEIVRWILGFVLIVPALILAISWKRNQRLTDEILSKKDRLRWLKTQLDLGASTRLYTRKTLLRSLTALQSVTWQEGTTSWGTPSIQHTTDGLEIMVWELDQRLSKDGTGIPLLIGLYAKEGTWDLAVLRIEAPEGAAYSIVNCTPKFLFRGEEVFIDTLTKGQLTYLQIDVQGTAKRLEVELNGRLNGQPFAAKIPHCIEMEEE